MLYCVRNVVLCRRVLCHPRSGVMDCQSRDSSHDSPRLTNVLVSQMSSCPSRDSSHECPRLTNVLVSPVLPRECSFVLALSLTHSAPFQSRVFAYTIPPRMPLVDQRHLERWGAGVEYHFQEFNEPYAPSEIVLNDGV